MPDLLAAVAATFVVSLILASGLLRLRCRGIGPPFARRARPWALLIVLATAIVSVGVGLLVVLVTVGHHSFAVFAGLVVTGGLWFAKVPPQRDLDLRPRTLASLPTRPFSRLYDRMGEDMQEWCDIRIRAASAKPQWIADAVTYYWVQVGGTLRDSRARDRLNLWRDSITHKIGIVGLIDQDISPELLGRSLQLQPSTRGMDRYAEEDLPRLARRLESDALSELHLFLAYIYRLGYYKLPTYPFRPPDLRKTRHAVRVLSAQG